MAHGFFDALMAGTRAVDGGIAMGAALLGWRPSIAPVVQTAGASVYNAATIERGRLLAAAGKTQRGIG